MSSEHQTEIDNLGNKMDLLHLEEGKLDRRCEEISTFFITNIEVYIAMTGVWFLSAIIISNTRTLLFLLGMITIAFGTGIGIAAYTSFRKLKRMRWKMHHIRRKRDKLRARVHELQTLLNNPTGGVMLRVRDATIVLGSAKKESLIWSKHLMNMEVLMRKICNTSLSAAQPRSYIL